MERAYNLKDTALLLGVKVNTIRQWLKKGTIKADKIAGTNRWFVRESEIKRLRGEQ